MAVVSLEGSSWCHGDGAALLRGQWEMWEGCGVGTTCLKHGGSCGDGCAWAAEEITLGTG